MLVGAKKIPGFRQGRINVASEVRRQGRVRANLEKGIYRKLTSLLPKFIRTEADRFSSSGSFSPEQASRNLQGELAPVMSRHYRRVFTTIFQTNESRYESLAKSVDAVVFGRNRDIEGLIEVYNRDRALFLSGITQNLANKVGNIITIGRENGDSLSQISKNINTQVGPISRRRAALIARTETHNAASYAHHHYHDAVQGELGVSMMKKWSSVSDARTRSAHVEASGQLRSMEEPFSVGGAEMQYAGDPNGGARNVVNCRCVIVYLDSDDVDGLCDAPVGATPTPIDRPISPVPKPPKPTGLGISDDGRPTNLISALSIRQMVKARVRTSKDAEESIKKKMIAGAASKEWDGPARTRNRFRGRKSSFGKSTMGRWGRTSEEAERIMVMIDETFNALNLMSQHFKIPPLRGIKKTSSRRYEMDMGDGVLGISTKILDHIIKMSSDSKLSRNHGWKRGDPLRERPRNASEYHDDVLDQIRSTIFHEFGHHLHQTKGLWRMKEWPKNRNDDFGRESPWEKEIRNMKAQTRGDHNARGERVNFNSPSRYGETNSKEWFAENFSLWASGGKDDLLDPDFVILIKRLSDPDG